MFKVYELREIIKLIDQSGINEFELEHEGSKLILKKQSLGQVVPVVTQAPASVQQAVPVSQPAVSTQPVESEKPAAEQAPAPVNSNLHPIKSPMVGTFYKAPAPDADPYVKVGDRVHENSVVCIVEAMKLFNEIEAEVKGEIVEILVENGQLVEYGQPLFLVKVN